MVKQHNKLAKTITAALITLSWAGCRSKLDVETKTGAPISSPSVPPELKSLEVPKKAETKAEVPKPEPEAPKGNEEVPEGLASFTKTHFQMRETIKISLMKSFVEGAKGIDVYNVTRAKPDAEDSAPLVLKDHVPTFSLNTWPVEYGDELSIKGDTVDLNIFSENKAARAKLFGGKNRLKIVVKDEARPRFTYVEIYIHSISHFEFVNQGVQQSTSRLEATNAKGYFLESWFNRITPATVKDPASKSTLTVGFNNMMFSH